MESPLQLLRELFPFGQANAEQKSAAAVRGLLETVTGLSPQETIAKLASSIMPSIGGQPNLHMRFKLLEDVRLEAEQALPVLEKQITLSVLPLPLDAATSALQADNVLKALAIAYTRIARTINKGHLNEGLSHLLHRCVWRAMAIIARRQFLAYRAYATPSASSWQALHELYQMVCGQRSKPLNGETAPIEHEYLGALLFAYLEPTKLPRTELDIINTCTRQLAAYALVGDVTADNANGKTTEACFLVRPEEGNPGYPMARLPSGTTTFGSLLIDCTQVITALDRNISRRPGKLIDPVLEAPPALLQALRTAISGKSTRRFNRTRFRPRVDLINGLLPVLNFLDGNTFSRRSVDASSHYDGRNFTTSEWAMVNESPDGFLLRFVKGEKSNLGTGDIVALQPRESSKIHVCLVRRIASSQVRLELGLQLMSPQVSVVDICADQIPDQRAVFLHSLPAYGKHSGLITAPGTVQTGQKITLKLPGRSLHRQIGTCMEANEGLEFFALDLLPD
jgi:cyclic-di-GMP-binding protein